MGVYMGVSDIPPYDRLFIPTISPRYDDTKVRSPGYSIGDELWEDSVEATKAVLAHRKPEFVFVTSWNEWHESTSVEPDISEGFKFLIEFSKEFHGVKLSEEDFLKALRGPRLLGAMWDLPEIGGGRVKAVANSSLNG